MLNGSIPISLYLYSCILCEIQLLQLFFCTTYIPHTFCAVILLHLPGLFQLKQIIGIFCLFMFTCFLLSIFAAGASQYLFKECATNIIVSIFFCFMSNPASPDIFLPFAHIQSKLGFKSITKIMMNTRI